MVVLHVGGKVVNWADAEKLFSETAYTQSVEFRDEAGRVIATTRPGDQPVPWDQTITQADIDRARAGPFLTFEEVKKRLGWE